MTKSKATPQVDALLRKAKKWQEELQKLRSIILTCPLTEEVKWRSACYTFQEKNVVLIGGFKEYCALLFVKGALLEDAKRILVRPGENTQAGRLIKFTSVQEIAAMQPVLKAYLQEAIAVEKAGLKVKKKIAVIIPEELADKFANVPKLKAAFEALTPGRQRAYTLFFSAANLSKTRQSRIEKCMPRILKGKGLSD